MGMKFSKAYEAELIAGADKVGPSAVPSEPRPASDAMRGSSTKVMNKLEASYASHLELRKMVGDIVDYKFGSIKLKVGVDCCWYLCDFWVLAKDGVMEFHETKGFFRGTGKVKLKSAAFQYPHFRFFLVRKDGKRFSVEAVK